MSDLITHPQPMEQVESLLDIARMARKAVECDTPEGRVENIFQAMKALLSLPTLPPTTQEAALKVIREELEAGLKTHK